MCVSWFMWDEIHKVLCVCISHGSWNGCLFMCRVGQNRIYTSYTTVYLVISLPEITYMHRIYIVLANPIYVSVYVYLCACAYKKGTSINVCTGPCMLVHCLLIASTTHEGR